VTVPAMQGMRRFPVPLSELARKPHLGPGLRLRHL